MSESELILAIDQGGLSTRAMVFDQNGQLVAARQMPVQTFRSNGNHVEHDAGELLASVRTAIAGVTAEVSAGKNRIVAAGLATQRSTIVCWNRQDGSALSPVISWQDTRAGDLLSRYAPVDEVIRRTTGLVRSPHYGASKLRWCLENIPAVRAAEKNRNLAMGPLSSYLLFHLLPDRAMYVDPVNASRTLLWDINTLNWSGDLLRAFKIKQDNLPVCVSNRFDFGLLCDLAIPLQVCTGDQNAAIFANGPVEAGVSYINIGTGAFVLARSDRVPDDTRLLRSVTWSDGTTVMRILEGTVNGAGSALASMHAGAAAIKDAATLIAAPDNPMFLNGVSGLASPYWREDFVSRFVGNGDDRSKLSAVLESVLFLLQVNLHQIALVSDLREIVISGGLARSNEVCQALADISGLPVLRPEEAEATARGVAFLAAGWPKSWRPSAQQSFYPANNSILRRRFSRWLEAMHSALES